MVVACGHPFEGLRLHVDSEDQLIQASDSLAP